MHGSRGSLICLDEPVVRPVYLQPATNDGFMIIYLVATVVNIGMELNTFPSSLAKSGLFLSPPAVRTNA